MKISEIKRLGKRAFEIESGHGDHRPCGEEFVEIKFGAIQTELTFRELKDDTEY